MFGWFKKKSPGAPADERRAPKPNQKVAATELAELLLNECIRKIVVDADPYKRRHLDATVTARCEAKTRLYQLATVLMALKCEEDKGPLFPRVKEHIESTVFASASDGGSSLRAEIGNAAQELSDLLALFAPAGQRRPVPPKAGLPASTGSWVRAWLLEISVDEWNPATCALIAINWVDFYLMVVDSLRGFDSNA
jgi:hypothetical protein